MSPPNEHTSQIALETCTKQPQKIANVFMKTVVGFARLHSLKTMQTIHFNAVVNQTVSRIIPLRNAGNITLKLQAKITGASGNFTVHPENLSIKPGGESEVKVSFSSNNSTTCDSRLFVTLQPDGHQYEWSLRGVCTTPPSPVPDKAILLCNKPAINWSGVAIGNSKQQKLVLRNSSDTKSIELSVSISDGHPSFRVHSSASLDEKSVNRFEAVLKPHGELAIHVSYSPTSLAMDKSSLTLRMLNGATKFVIPLAGYGGTSNLDICGAKCLKDRFFIDMGHVTAGHKKTMNVTLRNSGLRASFVAMKCFSDVTSKTEYPSTHVKITPNNFVLMEKTSCEISITFELLKEHSGSSNASQKTITAAHLAIYSGDEATRRAYQRYRRKVSCAKPQTSNTLKILHITSDFLNQTNVKEDVTYNKIADWEDFILSNINKNLVALVTKTNNEMEAEKLLTPVVGRRQMKPTDDEIVPVLPNTKSNDFKESLELWKVTPHHVVIDASLPSLPAAENNNSTQYRLKIINYSNKELPFKCYCPTDSLVITPSVDRVPPHSQLGIRLDPKHTVLSKYGHETWKGQVCVECRDEKRCVPVEVNNNMCTTTGILNNGVVDTKNQLVHDYTKPQQGLVPWSVTPKEIVLDTSHVSTEYKLHITNNTSRALPFEFIWPAETLVITPCKDKVPAHETLGIRIDAKHTFLAKHDDDSWHGSIYVQCGDEQQRVQIRIKNSKQANKFHVTNACPPPLPPPPAMLSHDVSLEPHQHYTSTAKEITISPQLLEFDATLPGFSTGSIFTIKNPTSGTCTWNIRPVCQSYFKSWKEKSSVTCVSSPVFRFLNSKGCIRAHEVMKVDVAFQPADSGIYSQFFELEVTSANGSVDKTRLEVIGKGQTAEKKPVETTDVNIIKKEQSSNSTTSNPPPPPQQTVTETTSVTRIGNIFVRDDIVRFPDTKPGQKSEMKFRLCNDGNEIQRVRVSGFRAPFSVISKHTRLSIKPKSYIRVPVYYSPTVPLTSSEGLLLLSPDDGNGRSLCVKLTGQSDRL